MNLDSVGKKLTGMAKKITAAKGRLELLGLFLREDSPDLWDLVIAAPWLKADERASFEYVASELREALANEELAGLSRIVILEHGGAALQSFLESFRSHAGLADVHFVTEGGAIIRKAYIITAYPVVDAAARRKTKKRRRGKANL
ncbi:MAG TPA: hypothetical protein VMG10_25495 [Gemmataceae bacterium]|nr:hypothetical protein [Gemmataceae bacterium]